MASITDKLTDTRNSARPNSAKVTASRSAGVTTLSCDNLAGWPTASAVHFVTYQVDTNNDPVAGTQVDWKGLVSGNNLGTLTLKDGTDAGNSVGDIVEMLPTAAWGQDLADALTAEHSRAGVHSTLTAATLVTPTIASFANATHTHANAAGGGQLSGADAITDGTITPAELSSGAGSSWAWQSWTPTWTNLTIGNGTNVAAYVQTGKTIHFRLRTTLGSTSSVSTTPGFSLPATMVSTYAANDVLNATIELNDASGFRNFGFALVGSTTRIDLTGINSSVVYTNITSSFPFTWTESDQIIVSGSYEAA